MRDANTSPEPPHPPQPDGGEVDGAAGSGKLLGRFLGSVLRSRLTAKVLLGVFLGIVLIEIIILVPSYSKRERDLLENEYSRVSNFVGAVMRTPSVSQEQKLALIASGDGVLGMIVIRDPMLADRARTAAEARRAGREQADAIKPYHYEASAGRLAVDYPLSTAFGADADDRVLRIFVSAAHIPEHLEAYVLRIIGLVVIISLFVTGVTMVIVGILLIRPLLSLTRTIAAGQKLETLSTLPPQLMSRKDEIGELARAYRDMVTSISEAVSRIEALARFPYENPNPVLRVGFDYSVQYANGSAQAEQALFSNDSQTAISQDLRSLASSAVVSDESSTSTIVTGFRVFSVTAVPVREYGYLNLYARDITSQVQAEKDLLALNERLEGLVEERSAELRIQARRLRSTIVAAIDAIVLMGLDGTILDFNPSAEVLFGRTRDQVLGKDLTDLLVPEAMRERHRNSIIRYLETGKKTVIGKRIELEALRSDGQLIPVEVSLEVTGEGDDRIFVAFLRDITERRDRRQALIEAKEAAERANRAKSDFLATMSHEIRTPMNGVIGMTGLLMDTALSQEQSHYVETIRQSGESLMRIINDILDYTKIEAGRLELETMPFDLEGLVDSVVDLMHGKAVEKGLRLGAMVEPEIMGRYVSDAGRIRQVLLNLTNNALKFTEKGSVSLKVIGGPEGICFQIHDTGVGIAPADQAKLFQRFSQVDASTSRKYGGTGLGLAISRLIVEALGGQIGVESTEGEGSVFSFTLPLTRDAEHAGDQDAQDRHQEALLQGKQVLVVDDDGVNQEIFVSYCRHWGMVVETVSSGEAALSRLQEAPFDLMVLDLNMPELDGNAVLRSMVDQVEIAPAVLVASSSSQGLDQDVRDHVGAMVLKPLKRHDLRSAILRVLDPGQQGSLVDPGRPEQGRETGKAAAGQDGLSAGQTPLEGQRLRILVAEDNPVNQTVAKKNLERLGHIVDIANDGQEAVQALIDLPYDLVLMDVQMPICDGFEATRRIRALTNGRAAVPVIAMTANAMAGDRERCILAGMDDYLSKPVNRGKLEEMLARHQPGLANDVSEPDPQDAVAADHPDPPHTTEPEPTPMTSGHPIWDEEALAVLIEDLEEEGFLMVLDIYRRNTPERLAAIAKAMETGDDQALRKEAHSLKGASRSLAAAEMGELAYGLEKQDQPVTIEALQAAFDRLIADADQRFPPEE